ncbi:hypothetical protein D3C85_572680 [compost metagenome]
MVRRTHHQCRKEHEQRGTCDPLRGDGGVILVQRQLCHGAAGPDIDAEQREQQAQLQRVDQWHVGQWLGVAVTGDIRQPEPAEHQQRQRRGGVYTVFPRVRRHRPRPRARRRHQNQIQTWQNRPTQPAPSVVLLGQHQQAITQLQRQHPHQQPTAEHMGDTRHACWQHGRQASQGHEMHHEHGGPRQPADVGRRVVTRVPGRQQHQRRRGNQHRTEHPQ